VNTQQRDARARDLKDIERYLERSAWGRGIYTQRWIVPAARPAQIRAGARKVLDQRLSRLKAGPA